MSKPWHKKVMAQCPDATSVTDKRASTRVSDRDWLGAVRSVRGQNGSTDIPVVVLDKVCDVPTAAWRTKCRFCSVSMSSRRVKRGGCRGRFGHWSLYA
jgi:hypothetical protein